MSGWKKFTSGITGGLLGDKNLSSTSNQTQNTQNDVLDWAKPYYEDVLKRGSALSKQAYTPFTGNRFAAPLTSNPMYSGARTLVNDTMNGKYLDITQNPQYTTMAQRLGVDFARGTAANTDAVAARTGAFGSSGWAEQQGANSRAYGDTLANLQAQLYGQERGNQMQAGQQAAQMADAEQQDAQKVNDFDYQQWLEKQGYDKQQIQDFGSLLATLVGNKGSVNSVGWSQQTDPNPNRTGGLLQTMGRFGNAMDSLSKGAGSLAKLGFM